MLGAIAKYAVLPGIMPRIRGLFGSGFEHVAYFLAQIYGAVGLLPRAHPYLISQNMGKFGVRHVVTEAMRFLQFKKENIDKIAVFALTVLGLVILAAQFLLLIISVFAQAAYAAEIDLGGVIQNGVSNMLGVSSPFGGTSSSGGSKDDLAFILLDSVFGVKGLFNSCVATGQACLGQQFSEGAFPTPFHHALHKMFSLYSIGLLVIGALIFVYFIVAIAAETAESGTPFGKRFNHVWAPIRMVVAFGLLIPTSSGLNSGQYAALYAAKYGSNFATRGWETFVDRAVSESKTLLGSRESLNAVPSVPNVQGVLSFFSAVSACKIAEEAIYNGQNVSGDGEKREINAYIINARKEPAQRMELNPGSSIGADGGMTGGHFEKALDFTKGPSGAYEDIRLVFGHLDESIQDSQYPGNVIPYCGELVFRIEGLNKDADPGSYYINQKYFEWLVLSWQNIADGVLSDGVPDFYDIGVGCNQAEGINVVSGCSNPDASGNTSGSYLNLLRNNSFLSDTASGVSASDYKTDDSYLMSADELNQIQRDLQKTFEEIIIRGLEIQNAQADWEEDLKRLGWGGAAIWYNKIAQLNGTFIGAAQNLPSPVGMPMVMDEVKSFRVKQDKGTSAPEWYNPTASKDVKFEPQNPKDYYIARVLYRSQAIWDDAYEPTGNVFKDIVQYIFGLGGVMNMRENIKQGVHPLAALTGIGRSLVDSVIMNVTIAGASGLISAVPGLGTFGAFAGTAGGAFGTIATIALVLGFVLYYIIPFMPFLYFFFALGGWVKGIFEAMVGIPLWALAHIKIDGEGLPGDKAMSGYFFILEIFLRPVLIIFGFLGSVLTLSAQLYVLNEIWWGEHGVTGSVGIEEVGLRNFFFSIDDFFFTIVYAIVAYMMAVSSFKLIDLVPNNIMRWMGAQVQSFGDQREDPGKNLLSQSFVASGYLGSGLKGAAEGAKGAVGKASKGVEAYLKK